MAGMAEVGRLFNNNELIVAEVLQSAEAMKAAVNHLEQFMEKADTAARGKVVLATVKGDVHDIGKNLVEIILNNNGYDVVNLGIKVPPEDLIRALSANIKPDAIGLSGLLVKSAQQMVTTAGDLARSRHRRAAAGRRRGALRKIHASRKSRRSYGTRRLYAKDAMTGLRLMNEIMDPAQRDDGASAAHTLRDAPCSTSPLRRTAAARRRSSARREGSHRHSDSARRRISTAKSAPSRICTKSGATSIRSCSTGGISASAEISRKLLAERDPQRARTVQQHGRSQARSRAAS